MGDRVRSVGRSHNSEEFSVMEMERRASVIRSNYFETTIKTWADLRRNDKITTDQYRGWINYYSKFNRDKVLQMFAYLNTLIKKWIRNTYNLRSVKWVAHKYNEVVKTNPDLFYHWKLGITY
jgi:hypothetical protein